MVPQSALHVTFFRKQFWKAHVTPLLLAPPEAAEDETAAAVARSHEKLLAALVKKKILQKVGTPLVHRAH